MTRWWWGFAGLVILSGCGASAAARPAAETRVGFNVRISVENTRGVVEGARATVAHNPFAQPPLSPYVELPVSPYVLPDSPY